MNIFISGGCKNGKSYFAQRCAKQLSEETKTPLYYVATMIPGDEEDKERIKRHIEDREGWGFETIEKGRDIGEIFMKVSPEGTFLVDSVTALLANEMFKEAAVNEKAYIKVAEDLKCFAKKAKNAVFVSDYIYSDAIFYDEMTEAYRKGLGYIDSILGEICDQVVESAYGQFLFYKR